MIIDTITVGPVSTNCYLLTCDRTEEALVIDPGDRSDSITEAINARKAKVRMIVNTHAHFDHIAGNAAIAAFTGAPIAIHEDALPMLRDRGLAPTWGITIERSPEPGRFLGDGDEVNIGDMKFSILSVPGHAPGHIALYAPADGVLFAGDVLFHRGVGRTDLPQSSGIQLIDSIRQKLYTLPDETTVYPGHGPATTIGDEKKNNPYLRIT